MNGFVLVSVAGRTVEELLEEASRAPAGAPLVELRVDRLDPDGVRRLVARVGRPCVVTARRTEEGGAFRGDESARRACLLAGLEAGAAYVDVEHGGALADLADGEHAGQVILSRHGLPCAADALDAAWREMAASRAAVLKLVPDARRVGELVAVRDLLGRAAATGRRLACFAAGRAGALSRILAPAWGSWATYASAARGSETAPGQFPAADLLDVFDVANIGAGGTRVALVGARVFESPSPAMHRAAALEAGCALHYLPVELDPDEDWEVLVEPGGVLEADGLAVTMPFKERVAARCRTLDGSARSARAVNTAQARGGALRGFNTDAPAIAALVAAAGAPLRSRVAVVGAGGTARAALAALARAARTCTLYCRDVARGAPVAAEHGAGCRPLAELPGAAWDVLVQATPLGREGEVVTPPETLGGRVVLDVVYGGETPLARDARRRGLTVIDGRDLLVAQGVLQFEILTGRRARAETMRRAVADRLRA